MTPKAVAVVLLCLLLAGCATLKPVCEPQIVYKEVRVPVPVPCPSAPAVQEPDLWVLRMDPATAPLSDLLEAIIHDVAELRRYGKEVATLLEAYQPEVP